MAAASGRQAANFGLAALFVAAAGATLVLTSMAWSPPRSRVGLVARARVLPWDEAYRAALAERDLAAGHARAAHARLLAALRQAPFSASLWLGRAEVALQLGWRDDARRAALTGSALAPTSSAICYRAATVLLQVDARREAAAKLRCVIEYTPWRGFEILDLAHAVYGDDGFVLREIVPGDVDTVEDFLRWSYDRTLPEAATQGWNALATLGPTPAARLRHIDFLISQGQTEAALPLWTPAYGAHEVGTIFNGDFEREPVGDGFDWRLGQPNGAHVAVARGAAVAQGQHGLSIEFSGGNVDFFHVSQVVPVRGSRRYRLSALVSSGGLTSLAGPHLRVQPHYYCGDMQPIDGVEWRGTRAWTPVTLTFSTPPECKSVLVLIERRPTDRFDRDLRGHLYLDAVRLEDMGAAEPPAAPAAAPSPAEPQ